MTDSWEDISGRISACSSCSKFCDCTKKIVGRGDTKASAVFVGERPSRSDIISGVAFSGKSGKYLLKMLHNAGYRKGDIYLTYAIKCQCHSESPPKEVQGFCSLYLLKQIDFIKPRLIVAMGSVAFNILCPGIKRELGGVRGDKIPSLGYTIMPVWHPNFVLSSFSKLRGQELEKDINRSYRYTFYGSSDK
jgi:uracil-DNA glycosylase family 4